MHQINLHAVWLLINERNQCAAISLASHSRGSMTSALVWGVLLTKITMVCACSHCLPSNYACAGKQAHGA